MTFCTIPHRVQRVTKAVTLDEVESLAASYEPMLAKAFLKAIDEAADALDLDALAEALATGNLGKVLDMLKIQLGPASDALQDVVWAGGAMAAKSVALRAVEFQFNRLNPVLIDWLQTYSLGLIREIGSSTREAVRNRLAEGMRMGRNPRTQAKDIKAVVGLTERQSVAVANYRNELENFHNKRTAAAYNLGGKIDRVNGAQVFKPGADGTPKDGIKARRLRDFRFDGQLQRAMLGNKPLTPAQVDKMVEAYARKYRKYRAETIARTEATRALNMGAQEAWRQAVMDGKIVEALVRREWKVAHDERTCPVCEPIPGMNAGGVGLGQPFETPKGPVMMPPLHPDCRCHLFIRQLEPAQVGGS